MTTRGSGKTTYFVALNKLGSAELEDSRLDLFIDRTRPQEPTIACDSIDQDGPLLRIAARIRGNDKVVLEAHIPHHFVLYVLGGTEKSFHTMNDRNV